MREVKPSESKKLLNFIHKNQKFINNVIRKKKILEKLKNKIEKTKENQEIFIMSLYIMSIATLIWVTTSLGCYHQILDQENNKYEMFILILLIIKLLEYYLPIGIFIKLVIEIPLRKFVFEKKLQKLNDKLNDYEKKFKILENNLFNLLNNSNVNKNFLSFISKNNDLLNLLNNKDVLYEKEKEFTRIKNIT